MKKKFYLLFISIVLTNFANAAEITSWKDNYPTGNSTWIEVKDKPNNPKDWIGIYRPNTSNSWSNVIAWAWARNTVPDTNDPGDWYEFELNDGAYEARFFLNNTYVTEDSVAFSVGEISEPTISIDDDAVLPNENIQLNLSNLSGDRDWVGIYPRNASNSWSNVVTWKWANNTHITLNGVSAGEYEARLFFGNSFNMEASAAFSVKEVLKYPPTSTLESRLSANDGVSKPIVGTPSIDDRFGTKISKINKVTGIATYPKMQSWNKDMTLIHVKYRLYNATTLEETLITKGLPDRGRNNAYAKLCSPNNLRWSNQEPNTFFAIDSLRQFIKATITNNDVNCTVVESFKDEFELVQLGPNEGNIDNNDQYVVLTLKKPDDLNVYIVLYDILNDERKWTKVMPDKSWELDRHGKYVPTFDWISVSQSGKHIVVNNTYYNIGGNLVHTGLTTYDNDFENGATLEYANGISQGGHGDVGYDVDGHEVFVAFVRGEGVFSYDLDNPHELAKRLTSSPYGGGHVSCRNTERPGWCYVSTRSAGYKRVFALKIDGTLETVQNFSQTHNKDDAYIVNGKPRPYAENYGAPSPDGTKVIFNSHWESESVGVFIAEVQ